VGIPNRLNKEVIFMDYFVLVFLSKFVAEVAIYAIKACFKRYKAKEKPGATTPDQ